MKKWIILALLFSTGCYQSSYKPISDEERAASRQALEQRFKESYPDNWKQKLLEHDMEMERAILQSVPPPAPIAIPQIQPVQPVQSIQPMQPMQPTQSGFPDNYWQEQRARQEYQQNAFKIPNPR
jgi:hypothetical protein